MNKILVVGLFNHMAGTEKVVVNYLSMFDEKIAFDVLSYGSHMHYFDDIFKKRNINEIIIPRKRDDYFGYLKALDSVIKQGHYSTVWLNAGNLTNIDSLRIAKKYKVPQRIFHAHNSTYVGDWHDQLLSRIHSVRLSSFATDYWACSKAAGNFFFSGASFIEINNAIDVSEFCFSIKSRRIAREELCVSDNCHLIGTIGRCADEKNHAWLLDFFASYIKDYPNSKLLIIGDGALYEDETSQIEKLGIAHSVIRIRKTNDVAKYLSSLDCLLLPSKFEGLPLVLVEAQFNGLPCIVSDCVSRECSISNDCHFLSLDDMSDWAFLCSTLCREDHCLISGERFDISEAAPKVQSLFIK